MVGPRGGEAILTVSCWTRRRCVAIWFRAIRCMRLADDREQLLPSRPDTGAGQHPAPSHERLKSTPTNRVTTHPREVKAPRSDSPFISDGPSEAVYQLSIRVRRAWADVLEPQKMKSSSTPVSPPSSSCSARKVLASKTHSCISMPRSSIGARALGSVPRRTRRGDRVGVDSKVRRRPIFAAAESTTCRTARVGATIRTEAEP